MFQKRTVLALLVGGMMTGLALSASADIGAGQEKSRISFSPIPFELQLQPDEKPQMVFILPCSQAGQMAGGMPFFAAMQTMMFQMTENMNATNIMPVTLQPVCA